MKKLLQPLIILNILSIMLAIFLFVPLDSKFQFHSTKDEISVTIHSQATTGADVRVVNGKNTLREYAEEYNFNISNFDEMDIQGNTPYKNISDPASIGNIIVYGKIIGVGTESSPNFEITHYKISNFSSDKYISLSLLAIIFLPLIILTDIFYIIKLIIKKNCPRR